MKIQSIQIQNFKFFSDNIPSIEIEAPKKHLLLYGENGSGKSSLYWALYTLLECANKENAEIQAYFTPADEKSLVNIHQPTDARVKIVLDNGDNYAIPLIATAPINQNPNAKEANYASDFLNYRFLFKAHNFKHGKDIDLFPLFESEILRYVKIAAANVFIKGQVGNVNFTNMLEVYKALKGEIPIAGNKTVLRTIFKSAFQDLINFINQKGNEILNEKLGYQNTDTQTYNLTFLLATDIQTRNITQNQDPNLTFRLTSYYGLDAPQISKPHSFLNEAKWSAIGLAIRLAILEYRLQNNSINADNTLQVLVLDDLMISLDMSNRDKVLNLIFSEYLDRYQVFILTHDRVFFEDAKNFLKSKYKNEGRRLGVAENELDNRWLADWLVLEMYEGMKNHPIPIITQHESYLQKANYYFKEQIDYNACGNNLRSTLEEFIREYLPGAYLIDNQGNPLPTNNLLLGLLLVKLREYYDYIGFDNTPIDTLDRHLSRSLNKSSHYNPRTNFFKQELADTFTILNILKANTNYPLLKTDEQIKLRIYTPTGAFHEYLITILDDIRLYKEHDNAIKFYKDEDKRRYSIQTYHPPTGVVQTINSNPTRVMTLFELYEETFIRLATRDTTIIRSTNIYQAFTDIHNVSLETLKS